MCSFCTDLKYQFPGKQAQFYWVILVLSLDLLSEQTVDKNLLIGFMFHFQIKTQPRSNLNLVTLNRHKDVTLMMFLGSFSNNGHLEFKSASDSNFLSKLPEPSAWPVLLQIFCERK